MVDRDGKVSIKPSEQRANSFQHLSESSKPFNKIVANANTLERRMSHSPRPDIAPSPSMRRESLTTINRISPNIPPSERSEMPSASPLRKAAMLSNSNVGRVLSPKIVAIRTPSKHQN